MKPEQARALVTETFPQTFDKGRFHHFVKELLNGFDETKAAPMTVPDAFAPHVRSCSRLGTYESPDGELADVLIVNTTEPWKLERTRTALRDFVAHKLKRGDSYKEAGLVAFVVPDARSWRFSFVRMEYESKRDPKTGKIAVEERLTPARRFSYIVGENESCHTAQSRFLDLLQDTENKPPLAKIEEAFSVETVTDEFFQQYKLLFLDLKDELDLLAKKDKTIDDEFAAKKVSTADFAKKLMGQIVFLYFLQKKGWLGVPKGGEWGNGAHNFLRQLFNRKFSDYENFFNDILEPLFYDTLATDRGHDAWCKIFNCRIPFLNGGLFEPLRDYDWSKTDIKIPDKFFANSDFVEQGVTGTGILDVFDRYNFTVNEAEPLEKEVAIDPEMLGKVFENLLEIKERKSKGSYYTPREIVHYMCQESLINYLDTAVNSKSESIGTEKRKQGLLGSEKSEQVLLTAPTYRKVIPRADIETFIHSGDQASHYELARVEGTSGKRQLPKTIETHARLLDDKLADIAVCDPAIGSGAFPVGMMQEIVRARSALTNYFNDPHERNSYHFKRHAIQNCIYGVDIDPGAVEIAKLRLWLSLVVDEDDVKQIKPLPNLDYKIVVGNSLLGVEKNLFNQELFKRLEELKPKHFDATDRKQKEKFKHEIDDLIQELTNGKETFDFEIYFSEIYHRKNGFDVIIRNPPYISFYSRQSQLDDHRSEVDLLRKSYIFTDKTIPGRLNSVMFFIEQSLAILRVSGSVSLIIDANFHENAFRNIRKHLLKNSLLYYFVDKFTAFENVHSDQVILSAIKGYSEINHKFRYFADFANAVSGNTRFTRQNDFCENQDCEFILTKNTIKSEGIAGLSDLYETVTGIQIGIGGDRQYNGVEIESLFYSDVRVNKNWFPIISLLGKDFFKYCDVKFRGFLNFDEDLGYKINRDVPKCNIAIPKYRNYVSEPKVVVRQSSDSIVASYVEEPCVAEYSAFSIRQKTSEFSLKYLLAILNSKFITYYARKNNIIKTGLKKQPQIRIKGLDVIPIKRISVREQLPFIQLADRILSAKQRDAGADVSALEQELDELVYALYALMPEEIKIVKGTK